MSRDLLYLGLKAIATRRELVNSFTIRSLEFDYIDEQNYDFLMEIGELAR
jgi:hypothetical protein